MLHQVQVPTTLQPSPQLTPYEWLGRGIFLGGLDQLLEALDELPPAEAEAEDEAELLFRLLE